MNPCSAGPIGLRSVLECVNMDEAKVPFVKNKNKSGGARRAGSGHQKAGLNSCDWTKANRARVKRQQPRPQG